MKEMRTILRVLSLATLSFLCYGAFTSEGATAEGPTVTITQPVHGALVQGQVTVAVTYRSASGVNVTDLELYVDKALAQQVKLNPPAPQGQHTFLWDTKSLAAGVHTITAIAIDAKGQPGNVAVSVYVDARQDGPDTQAPTVTLKSPANGAVVSGVVQLVANVLDNAGVGFVVFFLDDRMLFGTNHPPYQFSWDSTRVPNGPHSIRVYAYDAAQNTGESAPIVVTVNNPGGQTQPGQRLSQAKPAADTSSLRLQRDTQPDQKAAGMPATDAAPGGLPQPEIVADLQSAAPAAASAAPPASTTPAASAAPTRIAKAPTPPAAAPRPAARTPLVSPGTSRAQGNTVMAAGGALALPYAGMQQRVTMPADGSTPMLDAAVGAAPVVAIVATGPAANLVPNAEAARVAPPTGSTRRPAVSTRSGSNTAQLAQQDRAVAIAAPVPAATRVAAPATKEGGPLLSVPAGRSGSVTVARVDRDHQQTQPTAVISVYSTPPARPATTPSAPARKITVKPTGKGPLTMVFNGRPVKFDRAQPFAEAGIMFTPFRHIIEHQGGTVRWNNLIKQVRATADGRRIELTIGNPQAMVGGQPVQLQVAPSLKNGRTIVPVSFLREALDVVVEYDPATGRITIAAK